MDALERHQIDSVAFTNAAQVYNLFAVAGQLGRADSLRASLNCTLVASIGPVSSCALKHFRGDGGPRVQPSQARTTGLGA